jgi:ribosomal protein S18 acetylase RimI-like enzyme
VKLPEPVALEEVDLGQIEALLSEETARYLEWYRWDFTATARLVRQLVATHSLGGIALVDEGKVVGYSYFVVEENKALIGDAYVCDSHATPEAERLLMASTVEAVRRFPQARRLESQPMMLRYAYSHPRADRYDRQFLELDLRQTRWPEEFRAPEGFRIEGWNWRLEEEVAQLLYRAYRGHMDADINDQYRMPGKARVYLSNMIRYPACGGFSSEASYLVSDKRDGRLVGAVLASMSDVEEGKVGHVSQLCVEPGVRKAGLGRFLMHAALAKFCECSCEYSTLTVTTANKGAARLYQSLGYVERARLAAYVWPVWPF